MSSRQGEVYVQLKTKQRLRWIRELLNKDRRSQDEARGIVTMPITQDEIADRLLNERIEQLYPNIGALERELEHAEAELIAKLVSPPAGIQHL